MRRLGRDGWDEDEVKYTGNLAHTPEETRKRPRPLLSRGGMAAYQRIKDPAGQPAAGNPPTGKWDKMGHFFRGLLKIQGRIRIRFAAD